MDLSKFDGHTPGPWKVERRFSNGCEIVPRITCQRDDDRGCGWIADAIGAPYLGHESTLPNARLIAAAPNLLAEVRRLREVLVNLAAPCEAILMDGESRKWIAPQVWSAIESAAAQIRAALTEWSV